MKAIDGLIKRTKHLIDILSIDCWSGIQLRLETMAGLGLVGIASLEANPWTPPAQEAGNCCHSFLSESIPG